MITPNDLDRIAKRQELRGAKSFFKALKMQYTELATQYENGQPLKVNTKIIKNALIDFHTKTQIESAEWQYNDLEKRNPVKKLQLGVYDRLLGIVRAWVLLNTGASIQSISSTTLDVVRRAIAKGTEEGFGARKIGQLIRAEAKGQFTAYRSTVIARTEGTRAASQGHKFGAEQWENITGQKKWKSWSASADARTRQDHLAMLNSKPIPGDQKFKVGSTLMDAPGDPAGGAKECVNCRCRAYYMSERAARKIIAEANQGKPVGPTAAPRASRTRRKLPQEMSDAEANKIIKQWSGYESKENSFVNNFKDDHEYLETEQGAIVLAYTDNIYKGLNQYLRLGEAEKYIPSLGITKDFYKAATKRLSSALDKIPKKYKGEVYRGSFQLDKEVDIYEKAFKSGEIYTEKSFLSTSKSTMGKLGGNTHFTITSKKGTDIQNISFHYHEEEVLFKAGTKFKVVGFEKDGSQIFIKMEEI